MSLYTVISNQYKNEQYKYPPNTAAPCYSCQPIAPRCCPEKTKMLSGKTKMLSRKTKMLSGKKHSADV